MRPTIAVCGIGEDFEGAIRKDQPGAWMVGESCLPGGMMGADDARDRIAVGQTERRKPKPLCRDHHSKCEAPRRKEKFDCTTNSQKPGTEPLGTDIRRKSRA